MIRTLYLLVIFFIIGLQKMSGQVYLYKDCNYGGIEAAFTEGEYNLSSMINHGAANDDVSSIRVADGYELVMYADDNLTGPKITRTKDENCLVDYGWNDKISSIKVVKLPAVTASEDWQKEGN